MLERSSRPRELVRSLPPDELAANIFELGLEESAPLLQGAELEQVEFVADIFLWKDRALVEERAAAWLRTLVACGMERTLEWFRETEPELAVAVLKRCFIVATMDEEYHPPPWEQRMPSFSLDGIYFVGCDDPDLLAVGRWILTLLRGEEPRLYSSLLEGVIWDTAAESEWEAGEFRQRRLATFGFPDFDEALTIYEEIAPGRRAEHATAEPRENPDESRLPVPIAREPMPLAEGDILLARCLERIRDPLWQRTFFGEVAALANHVQVADGLSLCEPESRRTSFGKVIGYLNIALELLADRDETRAVSLLQQAYARHLFQVGYSRVRDVTQQARSLLREGWIAAMPGRTALLDSPWREIIEGIARPRPVCCETAAAPAPLYRQFRDLDDVAAAEEAVAFVESLGELLVGRLRLSPRQVEDLDRARKLAGSVHPVTFSNLFLTAVGHRLLGHPFAAIPLSPGEAGRILDILRRPPAATDGAAVQSGLHPARRREWFDQAASLLEGIDPGTRRRIRSFLEFCWTRLEEEFGSLAPDQLPDPRFLSALVVADPSFPDQPPDS